jgi:hypothetical protein
MRTLVFVVLGALVLTVLGLTYAQSPPARALKQFSDPKPDLRSPLPAEQQEITEALNAESTAANNYEIARARLEAAQARSRSALYKAMASVGIKPEDCVADNNQFACVSQDAKGISFKAKKPQTTPSPTP